MVKMKNKKNTNKNFAGTPLLPLKFFSDAPYWFYSYFVVKAYYAARPDPHHMSVAQFWVSEIKTATRHG